MKYIYVAGPYTLGDVAVNVRNAMMAGIDLMNMGFTPFVPHLSHWMHLLQPKPYEEWMAYDSEWLRKCDAVLRLPGESKGADYECTAAAFLGIPVYFSMSELLKAQEREEAGKAE